MEVYQAQADLLIGAAGVQRVIRVSSISIRGDRDQLLDSEMFTLHGTSKARTRAHGVSPWLFLNYVKDS